MLAQNSKHNDDNLNIVIMQQSRQLTNHSITKPSTDSALPRSITGMCIHATCRRHHRSSGEKITSRKRHNATQTPESTLQEADCSQRTRDHYCGTIALCCHCCNHGQSEICCRLTNPITTHTAKCFHNQYRRCSRDPCKTDINAGATDITCHCHITHHCHHHYKTSGVFEGNNNHKALSRHHKRRRDCARRRQQKLKERHLPVSTTKSSVSSDDQLDECPQRLSRQLSLQLHEIAIEIDAATSTLTDDNQSGCNSSTGTSNFSYKLAKDNNHSQLPIILAPMHEKDSCRGSLDSNMTRDTSELTGEESDRDTAESKRMHSLRKHAAEPYLAADESSPTAFAGCCDDLQCCNVNAESKMLNQCVKIKRKRFISGEYCSSCSKCSSCSCQLHTSSCSSIDDFEADLQEFDNGAGRKLHELTVSADCHRCQFQRQSTNSTMESANEEDNIAETGNVDATRLKRVIESESKHTSRRSSRESFCSCNSTSCCCCSCSYDECESSQVKPSGAAVYADAEHHSNTLTPISQPSTPFAEDAPTLRSISIGPEEDSTSLSQSAEFFSLSSNQQSLQQQLAVIETPAMVPPLKQCKHYSKHHRHKQDSSPVDNYL